ncbi:hypothetical protein GX411_08970 [Candidatus Fermentibacteria bacterium]|nr:hypothetical protein [Candidatus Fermentibacteria bacterium]
MTSAGSRQSEEFPGTPWRPAAVSRDEYAASAGFPEYVRGLAGDTPSGPNPNLPGFTNEGGLLGRGVCWWHSRLTRAALYLAYFEPGLPGPDGAGARRALSALMRCERVVAIPGYLCFRDFSMDHRHVVQRFLEQMQIHDGLFRFAWVDGLSGGSSLPPGRLAALMDSIYESNERDGLSYVKLQVPGWDAHAWIITEMKRTVDGGYLVRYLDSNSTSSASCRFVPGDARVGGRGVPWLQRTRELRKIRKAIEDFRRGRPAFRP